MVRRNVAVRALAGVLVLGLGGLMGTSHVSCAQSRAAAKRDEMPRPVLKALGKRLTIRVGADSWEALIEKVNPTFTWGGRDMLWVGKDEEENPEFTLDRAYVHQPSGEPAKWVLLGFRDGPSDRWSRKLSCNYIRRTARLYDEVPRGNDSGRGEYAIIRSTNAEAGTVYEIGWQSLRSCGSSGATYERRLYVLRDVKGQWHFIGEGPTESHGLRGYAKAYSYYYVRQSCVIWTGAPDAPLRIEFTVAHKKWEWAGDGAPEDFVPQPERVEYTETVLVGRLPARLRWTTQRPYMLARKGDTFEKVVKHLATWTLGWDTNRGDDRKIILRMWRRGLVGLNPELPREKIPEGTRIRLVTYAETIKEVQAGRKGRGGQRY